MAKSFEKTLNSIENLQEAIEYASTEKLTADNKKSEDLENIIKILENAQSTIIDAIVIFQKYETAQ